MSENYPHLSKAPIQEAILDISTIPIPGTTLKDLLPFTERVKANFPKAKPIQRVDAQFSVNPAKSGQGPTQDVKSTTIGTIHWTEDQKRAVQAKLEGFTVNLVGDYKDWSSLKTLGQELWQAYTAVVHPVAITRTALRFINRITLPKTGLNLSNHFRTMPQVNPNLPQNWSNYAMRVSIPLGSNVFGIVTQVLEEPNPTQADVNVILDIDVFSNRVFGQDNIADIWEELDMIRAGKNRLFFESLTPEQWEVYR